MGDAKRKRLLQQAAAGVKVPDINRECFVKAVKQVIAAVTDFPGADCILYASVGAGLLDKLGLPAVPVAGSAAWRVGPGDSDVVSHAVEVTGQAYAPKGEMVGMFHCWIETAPAVAWQFPEIVDLTTGQLRKKARDLDAMDGQVTVVDYCPEYLWVDKNAKQLLSPKAVVRSYDVGVYAYLRKPEIEPTIFSAERLKEAEHLVSAASLCYYGLLRDEPVQVLGVSEDGVVEPADEIKPMQLHRRPRGAGI